MWKGPAVGAILDFRLEQKIKHFVGNTQGSLEELQTWVVFEQ